MIVKEIDTGLLAPDGKKIKFYSLENENGSSVILSNLGAGIVSICVPDRNGHIDDVALGYSKASDYYDDGPCMGKIPGRYANRIASGKFSLNGREYALPINNGPNHLHGGPGEDCFANRIWTAVPGVLGVSFALFSPEGDAGYPGSVMIEAIYSFGDDDKLVLHIKAQTDTETIVNLTNHVYFNLKGTSSIAVKNDNTEDKGIRGHFLKLYASKYLPTDETLIPTGELASVEGTPMDFTVERRLGECLSSDFDAVKYGKGYDNCWVVDNYNPTVVKRVAELYEPVSGRRLVVRTNQPGIQIYTGNWLAGSPVSRDGVQFEDYDGVALECQAFPDSPNHPDFPFSPIKCGDEYENIIEWKFDIR